LLESKPNVAAEYVKAMAGGSATPLPSSLSPLALIICAAAFAIPQTRFLAPPHYDGAGYAILAKSLVSGSGYRAIDHPDAPRHNHFPPGYPLALAALWRFTGISIPAAHAFSLVLSIASVPLYGKWFSRLFDARLAWWLALALAVNWRWSREAGVIRSEPLFIFLVGLALCLATAPARLRSLAVRLLYGLVLGATMLTRHVGLVVVLVLLLETLRQSDLPGGQPASRRARLAPFVVAALVFAPWLAFVSQGSEGSQFTLWHDRTKPPLSVALGNLTFMTDRIPDLCFGPFVEVATVYQDQPMIRLAARAFAAVFVLVVLLGWVAASQPLPRRTFALIPIGTLGLLAAWPFTEAGRFLVPLLPWFLLGFVHGARSLLERLNRLGLIHWLPPLVFALSLPYSLYGLATDRASAAERTHEDFDSACAWIATNADLPGPVMTRQPGEAYWLTGRRALAPPADPSSLESELERYGVRYLVVDEARFTNAEPSPLAAFVAASPDRVRETFSSRAVRVFELVDP
jgi:4-amino-4-deoxy-L-arabinose transferase-like glycosyltransferase